jgi:signal transduction histidine kinase
VERLERTFNWARLGGAALAFFLGPLFPNIGLAYVIGLGVFMTAYAGAVAGILRSERLRATFPRIVRFMFAIDLMIVAYALLVFSRDRDWSTYLIVPLLIIAGGFRFGALGAFFAGTFLAMAYVAISVYRAETYGYALEPQRMVFHVAVFVIASYLMTGILRELEALRTQREGFVKATAEAAMLRQADHIKSEFLAAMSHDFRSPLTVVRGAVELLLGERPGTLTPQQRDLAESAERNVRRLEEFTEQLLEMARLEEGQVTLDKEELDPVSLLRDVVAEHSPLAKAKRQWIRLDLDGGPPTVVGDRSRIAQALANLVVNAIRYSPNGTPIQISARRSGEAVRIEVRDHGPGIPHEDRQRIFDKFFRGRTSDGTAGSGLGLAIARSLLTLHGGSLDYEETPGGGSTFVASLPVATP